MSRSRRHAGAGGRSRGRRRVPFLAALVATCWLPLSLPARAATPAEIFELGNEAYEATRYEEAAAAYEKILAYGLRDPRVHYNLGNAYFKLGRLGPSILHYERSLEIDPGDAEARANLEFATGLIRDRVPEPEIQYPILAIKNLLDRISSNRMAVIFLIPYLIATGLAGTIPLVRDVAKRRLLAYVTVLVGLVVVLMLVGLVYKIEDASAVRAIVMRDRVDVLSGPAADNTVLFTVHEGTRLDVRNQLDGWYQISLPNALSGWIPASTVERV